MFELLLLALSGCGFVGGVISFRAGEVARWRSNLVVYELRFPTDNDPEAVVRAITSLSGLVASKWVRPFVVRAVIFETLGTSAGIHHRMILSASDAARALPQLQTALPRVSFRETENAEPAVPQLARELCLAPTMRPLRTDDAAGASAALLASVAGLRRDEEAIIQVVVSPSGPVAAGPSSTRFGGLLPGVSARLDPDERRADREKRKEALFGVAIRLGAAAPAAEQRLKLMHRMVGAYHMLNTAGAHLERRSLPGALVARQITDRRPPLFGYPAPLNSREVCAAAALPVGAPQVEGLRLSVSSPRPVPDDLSPHGLVLGHSNHPRHEGRPIAISYRGGAMEHTLAIAPTGSGKSTFLTGIAHQLMSARYGLLLLDPNRDTARAVLETVPSDAKVVWFDPSESDIVPFNPLAGLAATPELAADLVVNAVRHRWGATSWGPLLEGFLWLGTATVAATKQTLVDLPRVYYDGAYRAELLAQIEDPFIHQEWSRFSARTPEDQTHVTQSTLNKVRIFERPELRAVLGSRTTRGLDLESALAQGQVVLASLPKARLGSDGVSVLTGLLLGRLWMAILRRGELPPSARRPFFALVDEAHELAGLPVSLGLALQESRKHLVGWVLSTQATSAFPSRGGLLREVLTNTRNKVVWATSATEARVLASELGSDVSVEEIQSLEQFHVLIAASIGGKTTLPATATALGPVSPSGYGPQALVKSRERFSRPRHEIEVEIRERLSARSVDGAVRRRRRS